LTAAALAAAEARGTALTPTLTAAALAAAEARGAALTQTLTTATAKPGAAALLPALTAATAEASTAALRPALTASLTAAAEASTAAAPALTTAARRTTTLAAPLRPAGRVLPCRRRRYLGRRPIRSHVPVLSPQRPARPIILGDIDLIVRRLIVFLGTSGFCGQSTFRRLIIAWHTSHLFTVGDEFIG
jgi:hypothetical protein